MLDITVKGMTELLRLVLPADTVICRFEQWSPKVLQSKQKIIFLIPGKDDDKIPVIVFIFYPQEKKGCWLEINSLKHLSYLSNPLFKGIDIRSSLLKEEEDSITKVLYCCYRELGYRDDQIIKKEIQQKLAQKINLPIPKELNLGGQISLLFLLQTLKKRETGFSFKRSLQLAIQFTWAPFTYLFFKLLAKKLYLNDTTQTYAGYFGVVIGLALTYLNLEGSSYLLLAYFLTLVSQKFIRQWQQDNWMLIHTTWLHLSRAYIMKDARAFWSAFYGLLTALGLKGLFKRYQTRFSNLLPQEEQTFFLFFTLQLGYFLGKHIPFFYEKYQRRQDFLHHEWEVIEKMFAEQSDYSDLSLSFPSYLSSVTPDQFKASWKYQNNIYSRTCFFLPEEKIVCDPVDVHLEESIVTADSVSFPS